ncbi:MAG: autotransporter-associated beta strand repeat-containing protein, partial [Capsulimonadales bacterium]|nr:autotransporter-associated beta strand repeat-containing protein [Capsulimonadales bacterium]
MRSVRRVATAGTVAAALSLLASSAQAQYIWTGLGADTNWTTGLNWNLLSAPVAGSDVQFLAAAPSINSVVNANFSISSLLFGATAPAFRILSSGGSSLTIGAGGITHNGSVTQQIFAPVILSADQTWNVSSATGTLQVLGNISGAQTITKAGSGALTLAGTNTFSGLNISAGTVNTNAAGNNISDTAAVDLSGATAILNLNQAETIGSLAGVAGSQVNISFRTLTAGGNNNTTTFAGVLAGSGGFVKAGTGTLTLSGTNTLSGSYTVNGGTLQLGGSGTNISNVAALIVNGGTFALGAAGETIGSLAGTGGTVSLGGSTLTLSGTATTTYAGVITGTGGLTKTGGGVLTLTGAKTYTGATTLSGTAGLAIGDGGTTGSLTSNVVLNGSGTSLTFNRSDASTYANVISGNGAVNKNGAGTLFLTGTNTNLGTLSINAGTVSVGNGGATGAIANSSVVIAGGANLTFDRTGSTSLGGIISGAGSVTKNGTGTVTLSGANTFTGGLTVNAGTLQLGNTGANLADTGAVVVDGGTLALGFANETIGSLAGAGGTVFTNARILTLGGTNTSTVYAGAITGTGGITKNGTGTFTLTGTNTYTGATTVNAGSVIVGDGGTSGSIAGPVSVAGGANLTFNRSDDLTYGGVISGTGSVTKDGAGILTLSGTSTYSGPTTVNAGTLNVTGAAASTDVTV